ncbi:hypothetical protein PC9H_005917 [Pleurotus ostreatus]|uniref:Ctf8-domain-containing protein n=1 Tax=Pleurotus ostreatus TaxID=5322 RepID=A0A8H7DR19_PLEOS|nr:uncharacterized protein PC9H_005917 [Pleurotus ostreatus]KAF7430215.1 hypothetical protein PC9H_005917 [Pleurotus ostreatus]
MIIPITLSTSPGAKLPSGLAKISHDEVVLIELQGALEVETTKPGEHDGKVVGRLTIDEVTSKPKLMIGHHLLEGKIATLAKPLAVLHRASPPHGTSDAMDCDQNLDRSTVDAGQMGAGFEETGRTSDNQWEIIAVVKKKILFSNRPMPIVKLRG